MELLSQRITVGTISVEIAVHDLSFRMGFLPGKVPTDHLYVRLTAHDAMGVRLWTTPLLTEKGKIKAFSSVAEAILNAKERISTHDDDKVDPKIQTDPYGPSANSARAPS